MRLLFIHASYFEYKVTSKTKFATPLSPKERQGERSNTLIVLFSVEEEDCLDLNLLSEKACTEIQDVYLKVKAESIVLYPYSHLSSELAPPEFAKVVQAEIKKRLDGFDVLEVPFGWYKAFKIHHLGHPLSELSRTVSIKGEAKPKKTYLREATKGHHPRDGMSDEDIANRLSPLKAPKTQEGGVLLTRLLNEILKNSKMVGPVEVLIYQGKFLDKHIKIWVYNWDNQKPLLSYAALNEVFVYDGEIFGLPPKVEGMGGVPHNLQKVYDDGVPTKLKFIDLILAGFVFECERCIQSQERGIEKRLKIVKRASDINLNVPDDVREFMQANNKKMNLFGPLFFGLRAKIYG